MPVPDPLQPDLPQPEVPQPLRRVLPAVRWEAVTNGQSGAQVWSSRRHVLKVVARQGLARPLHAELLRLRWLAGRLPVPEVVGYEVTPDAEYLAVARLPAVLAVEPLHVLEPGDIIVDDSEFDLEPSMKSGMPITITSCTAGWV